MFEVPATTGVLPGGRPRAHLALVLHAHLPFVRAPEDDRHLEGRWLEETLLETYLPLLDVFDRLEADGVPGSLSLGLTPTLIEMLRDPLLMGRFATRLDRLDALVTAELPRTPPEFLPALAFHRDRTARARTVLARHGGDVVGGFVHHATIGRLDLLASAATHAFLPALPPRALDAQVRIGALAFRNATGFAPTGFWLPECAIDRVVEAAIARAGLRYAVVEADAVLGARPKPPLGVRAPIASAHGVALFGRDPAASEEVWSAEVGFPGHPAYREWHRDVGFDRPVDQLLGDIAWLLSEGLHDDDLVAHFGGGAFALLAHADLDLAALSARVGERLAQDLGPRVTRPTFELVSARFDPQAPVSIETLLAGVEGTLLARHG